MKVHPFLLAALVSSTKARDNRIRYLKSGKGGNAVWPDGIEEYNPPTPTNQEGNTAGDEAITAYYAGMPEDENGSNRQACSIDSWEFGEGDNYKCQANNDCKSGFCAQIGVWFYCLEPSTAPGWVIPKVDPTDCASGGTGGGATDSTGETSPPNRGVEQGEEEEDEGDSGCIDPPIPSRDGNPPGPNWACNQSCDCESDTCVVSDAIAGGICVNSIPSGFKEI